MKEERKSNIALEDRIFRIAMYIGFSGVAILLLYDVFSTRYAPSILFETLAIAFVIANIYINRNGKSNKLQRVIFSVVAMLLVNAGWITGGGISYLHTTIYLLVAALIVSINVERSYPILLVIWLVNFSILFVLEYFFQFNLSPDYDGNKEGLLRMFIIFFLLVSFTLLLIAYLKIQYEKERDMLNSTNRLLNEKSIQLQRSNEALKKSKEALNETVESLEIQQDELIEIKSSLEDKVEERTEDLIKLNKRLISQNQQLEQYAYITSHNLRAPIAQIKGLVNLLPNKDQFDQMTQETLERLAKSMTSLQRVMDDLSMILKVEKDLQQAWQQVDICQQLDEVIGSLKPTISKKGIKIIKPNFQQVQIKALKPYVFSIIHNIIENAVKYSDASKQQSFIKVEMSDSPKFQLVAITDNGIGIDMGVASGKLFQMYQRFNNTHPGQGFGLYLVKSQMEAMDGAVEVESVLGQGTTFTLFFKKQ